MKLTDLFQTDVFMFFLSSLSVSPSSCHPHLLTLPPPRPPSPLAPSSPRAASSVKAGRGGGASFTMSQFMHIVLPPCLTRPEVTSGGSDASFNAGEERHGGEGGVGGEKGRATVSLLSIHAGKEGRVEKTSGEAGRKDRENVRKWRTTRK